MAVHRAKRDVIAQEALVAVDRYLETWNSRDRHAWANSLHFPHVRSSASFQLFVIQSAEEHANHDWLSDRIAKILSTGWHRTQWDSKRVIHVGKAKVHVAGQYTRYNVEGKPLRTSVVMYIVTKLNERWAIQSRFGAGQLNLTDSERIDMVSSAKAAVETYVSSLNSMDDEKLAKSLNYPYVLIANGMIEFWRTPEEYTTGLELGRQRTWSHSKLGSIEAVQVADGGINMAVRFDHYNTKGNKLSAYEAVLLVTNREGHWGIQACSRLPSFD
jgi:hypothetical protein